MKLRFKECYQVERADPSTVFLFAEDETHLLDGDVYGYLAPLLQQGCYSDTELVSQLENQASSLEIYYALARLERRGFIEHAHTVPKERAAFYHAMKIAPLDAEERLQKTPVAFQSFGAIDETPFREAFQELGICITSKSSLLTIILVHDYLDVSLRSWNQIAKTSWFLLKPFGAQLWLGPWFEPGRTACWECLASRIAINRLEEGYLRHKNPEARSVVPSVAALPATVKVAAQLAALEVFKAIVQPECKTFQNHLLSLNFLTFEVEKHTVVRRPQCEHCGLSNPLKEPPPLVLQPQKIIGLSEGGYRTLSAEAVLQKYGHHVSPISGIVQRLISPEINNSKRAIYVFHAGHNFALSNEWTGVLKKSARSASGGKGRSEMQAKASCLCEGIERYCGLWQGSELNRSASYRELGASALFPATYFHFSEQQYASRHAVNPDAILFHQVPEPFNEEAVIDWTPVWSLTTQTHRYFPTAYCYYGVPRVRGGAMFRGDSNGNAAGNTLEEAILQGFFELVERDGIAIWWYNRLSRPSVDLESFQDPFFAALVESYQQMGRELWVLDITSDLGIPTFVALSRKMEGSEQRILMGFGAHLDPHIAIERALTEMNQSLGLEQQAIEETDDPEARFVKEWLTTVRLEEHRYLAPGSSIKTAKDYATIVPRDLLEAIHHCQRIVETAGMELFVLDQTRPDIELRVVKVIVPGLRHFWPRFAPGRLYDVPVKMGWLSKPLTESELNPIGMFL